MGMKMLSVALAAIALGAVTVAPASAATGNDIIEIRSVAHGDCLQPDTPQPHAGPGVGACTGASNQRWEQIAVGGGRYLLRNLASTECVSTKFGSYWCDDEGADMFAELVPDASGAVRVKFGAEYMTGLTFGDGSREIWFPSFRGDPAEELWQVRVVGTTTPPADTKGQIVHIKSVDATYGCLYVTSDNQLMTLSLPCGKTEYQKFQRIELADGTTALRSLANGKCIAQNEQSPTRIEVLADCAADTTRHHWTIEPTKTGAARLFTGDHYLTPNSDRVFAYPRQRETNTWQLWELVAA
ncbi:hypothetical protein ACFOWZ_18010 [Lentzea rhizosphaerae]|uniref:Ricin B lectin domain-containing protein n=1 Tax=Lentzea rhizosphaerae TaxID=2041025 RepID=A0ABV8BSL3_9PSEU